MESLIEICYFVLNDNQRRGILSEMRKENDLRNDAMWGLVLRLTIPAMLAQFINVLYSIVDRIFIGNIPEIGAIALAGVGICGPIVTLITSFSIWVGIGGSPLMSIRMGEDDLDEARRIMANCFLMMVMMGVAITLLVIAFRQPLLMLFGASEATFSLRQYIYDDLCRRQCLCNRRHGHECVCHLSGLFQNGDVFGCDRSSHQHRA